MNRLPYIVIVVLIAVILIMRSCSGEYIDFPDKVTVKTDTVYKEIHDTITKSVNIESIRYVDGPKFVSLDTCNRAYNRQTVYRDTIAIDSIGSITVLDTVFQNKLLNRTVFKDYRIPTVTKTITITKTQPAKRQLYAGGNLFLNGSQLQSVTPGLIYKDRRDRVYQISAGVDANGSIIYGAGMYWKIKL